MSEAEYPNTDKGDRDPGLSRIEIVMFDEEGIVIRSLRSGRVWGVRVEGNDDTEVVSVIQLERGHVDRMTG